MDDCVFCKIVRGEIPSTKIFEDGEFVVFENINPVAEVHLLICPKEHIESFEQIDESLDLNKMVDVAKSVIKMKNLKSGYKLVFNGGKYQSIPHLHWHLLAGELEDNGDSVNKT